MSSKKININTKILIFQYKLFTTETKTLYSIHSQENMLRKIRFGDKNKTNLIGSYFLIIITILSHFKRMRQFFKIYAKFMQIVREK